MLKRFISSKLYLRSILIFVFTTLVITLTLSAWIGSLLNRNARIEFLHSYDKVVNDLNRSMQTKQRNFHTELAPLFQEQGNYNALIRLMTEPSELPPSVRHDAVDVLDELCSRNRFSIGITLYSSETQRIFYYDRTRQTLSVSSFDSKHLEVDFLNSQLLSYQELLSLEIPLYFPAYGFTATLYHQKSSYVTPAGWAVFLYNVNELNEIIDPYAFPTDSCIVLLNGQGYPVYTSQENYLTKLVSLPFELPEKQAQNVIYSASEFTREQTELFWGGIYNGRYEYFTYYEVPASECGGSEVTPLVFLFAASIFMLAVVSYIVGIYRNQKKVHSIEIGMEHIGENNLDYRIPLTKDEDVYQQIIKGFNRMCDELVRNIEKQYIYELQQKQSELYAMQVSLNPHFLYNTLEIIRVQSLSDKPQDVSQMILLLSRIYRNQVSRRMYLSIFEEVEHCKNILYLYQYRFPQVEYLFSIDDEILTYGVPNNILQPIIENYFLYGFDALRSDNLLEISGECLFQEDPPMLRLVVEDNGKSITDERLEEIQLRLDRSVLSSKDDRGLALPNIYSRLRIVFGDSVRMSLSRQDKDCGFRVEMIFPMLRPKELEGNK